MAPCGVDKWRPLGAERRGSGPLHEPAARRGSRRNQLSLEPAYASAKQADCPSPPRRVRQRRLRLLRADLEVLDIDMEQYQSVNYRRTQEIGAAVAFLGCDGLIAPSARWSCGNLVIFTENHALTSRLEVVASEEIDWQSWARDAGFLEIVVVRA
jgi:hypothetical protein